MPLYNKNRKSVTIQFERDFMVVTKKGKRTFLIFFIGFYQISRLKAADTSIVEKNQSESGDSSSS